MKDELKSKEQLIDELLILRQRMAVVEALLPETAKTNGKRKNTRNAQALPKFEAEAQHRQEIEALRDTAAALNSKLDLEEVLERILTNVGRVVSYDAANIMLSESGHSRIVCQQGYGQREIEEKTSALQLKISDIPHLHQMSETEQPLVIPDTQAHPDWVDIPEMQRVRSYVGTPIRRKEKVIGFLNLVSDTPNFFTTGHAERLPAFADQAAVILENAHLQTEMERQARELGALNKASRTMASTLELNRVLQQAMAEVRALLNAEGASVLLYDKPNDELVFAAVAGAGSEKLAGTRLPVSVGVAGWALRERQPILVDDAQHDAHFYDGIDTAIGLTTRSLLAVPLIFEDTVIGVVEAINKAKGVFTQHDLELLEGLTSSAALAIDRAKLFEAEHHQRKIAETLGEVARVVNSSLELSKVLDRVLLELEKVIPYDSAAVMLLERNVLQMTAGRGFVDLEAVMSQPVPLADMPAAQKAVDQRHWSIVSDTEQEPFFAPTVGRSNTIRCVIAIPLISRGEVIGLLSVDSRTPDRYSDQDAAVAFRFAQQVAVAIENARLYENLQGQMRALKETQAQLIHSEKMAALGRLVASIAHEINNPLQSVQTCLTLTKEEIDGNQRRDKVDRYLGIVEGQIDHISNIVRRMRDFYRPARHEWHPTDLHSVLESVLELTAKQLQHSYITIERRWASNLPPIQANADHLKQVFLNLVLNAIDAMPQGGVLHIRTAPAQIQGSVEQPPRPAIRLEFSDTGEGMSPETLDHLFEPFFTTKRRGSGLGLSISHGIIEAHQGQISVASQLGLGTTFTILLPVEQASNIEVRREKE